MYVLILVIGIILIVQNYVNLKLLESTREEIKNLKGWDGLFDEI